MPAMLGRHGANVRATTNNELAIIDTSGGFGVGVLDVKTLLNRSDVKTFAGAQLDANVFIEASGARRAIETMTPTAARDALARAGMTDDEIAQPLASFNARREAMIDRYNLDYRHSPVNRGARIESDVEKLAQKLGSARFTDAATTHSGALISASFEQTMPDLVDATLTKRDAKLAQKLFGDWSNSSRSPGAAAIKSWAIERFELNDDAYHFHAEKNIGQDLELFLTTRKTTRERVFEVLDREYVLHQYALRRLYGWEPIRVDRGDFVGSMMIGKTYRGNAAFSTQIMPVASFASRSHRFRIDARPESVLKTYAQGDDYLRHGVGEMEYVLIGGDRRAVRLHRMPDGRWVE